MRFLVDNQLPFALARFLAARCESSQHVSDIGLAQATDVQVWHYASVTSAILISKDGDFPHYASLPHATARLVWVRLGNCRTQILIEAIDRQWWEISSAFGSGDRVIEIR